MAKKLDEVNKFYIEHHKDKKTAEELVSVTKLPLAVIKQYLESFNDFVKKDGTTCITGSQSLKDGEQHKPSVNPEYLKFKLDPNKPTK